MFSHRIRLQIVKENSCFCGVRGRYNEYSYKYVHYLMMKGALGIVGTYAKECRFKSLLRFEKYLA